MRILVTGGAGFIGSAVCRDFVLRRRWDVLNVDKLTYAANLKSLAALEGKQGYRFVRGDICDRSTLDALFQDFSPTAVIHLAAESHVDRSISASADFIQTNVVGTHTLLEAARAYWLKLQGQAKRDFRFHHVSTDEVYGSLGDNEASFNEITPYDPHSPYSASKASSDHLVNAWHHTYGLPVIMTNCSNNYGPFHFPEKLIPLMTLNALEQRPLPIYGDGLNIRDWLYVEDHVHALALVLTEGRVGEKYNIGAYSERTNLHVAQMICDLLDELQPTRRSHRDLIHFVPDRPGHDRRYAIDATKIHTELGWKPAETFESGIRKTVQWYLDNRQWWEPLRKIYSGERIGLTGA